MSPIRYASFAERAFPFRWWIGAAAIFGIVLVALLATEAGGSGVRAAAVLAGPLIGLPWVALCAAIWFHPVHGNVQPGSRLVGRLPAQVQTGVRWYAAAFLGIFVLVCAVAWPLFAFSVL
jgi:hypothetical protein